MPRPAVVIAAPSVMPALREHLAGEGELLTFADTEPIQALQAMLERRPRLIVLERMFAATPRGAALINRIKNDAQLTGAELRVVSHTGDYTRQVTKPSSDAATPPAGGGETESAVATVAEPAARAVDWHGTRRASRHRMRPGVEIQLDGNPVTLIDMSAVGAQVISSTILRPNQKVRVSVPTDDFVMRFRGAIAWAKFELPKPADPPRYRAGVEFTDADQAAMDEFCSKNKA